MWGAGAPGDPQARGRGRTALLAASGAAAAAAVAAGLLGSPRAPLPGGGGGRVLTPAELAGFSGEAGTADPGTLYLGLLGEVFDVSKGRKHYGVGGGYHCFAGRDATRAFITGEFAGPGLTDDVAGLTDEELKGLWDWRSFYHKDYTYVGKLAGRFYDAEGRPRPLLTAVREGAERAREVEREREEARRKNPRCNSAWKQGEGGRLWCAPGWYPRKVTAANGAGTASASCQCFDEVGFSDVRAVYPGCSPTASECKVGTAKGKEGPGPTAVGAVR